MDPKNLPNLDPKLKEVYERVMKTPIAPPSSNPPPSSPQTPSQTPPPPPQPQPNQPQPPPPPVTPPAPAVKPPPPAPPTSDTLHSAQVFDPNAPVTAPPSKDAVPKGKTKISPVVLVLAGVVFFVVYAVFWVSFFSVSLPF